MTDKVKIDSKCGNNCDGAICPHYKQCALLQRKEQECEELREMLNNPEVKVTLIDVQTGEREVWRKLGRKANHYKQALEKIEEYCTEQNLKYDNTACDILDIISKAKENGNAR